MNTLTKILIVLLTLSSIFLCGIVVTYVTNADNYRQLYDAERKAKQIADTKAKSAEDQLAERKKQYQEQEDALKQQIASLNTEIGKVGNDLKNANREKTSLEQQVQSWVSVTKDFTKTNADQGELLKRTLAELKRVEAEQITQGKELDETRTELIAKMAIIDTLKANQKRLEEERHALQLELDKILLQRGKQVAPVALVTPEPAPGPPVEPFAETVGLKGSITGLDLNYALAEISIGTAQGVREGMTFYVTRGDTFICEILVFDVDTEKAVGDLKRIREQPRIGDGVSTNL